jgi:hypothetical protein
LFEAVRFVPQVRANHSSKRSLACLSAPRGGVRCQDLESRASLVSGGMSGRNLSFKTFAGISVGGLYRVRSAAQLWPPVLSEQPDLKTS